MYDSRLFAVVNDFGLPNQTERLPLIFSAGLVRIIERFERQLSRKIFGNCGWHATFFGHSSAQQPLGV